MCCARMILYTVSDTLLVGVIAFSKLTEGQMAERLVIGVHKAST